MNEESAVTFLVINEEFISYFDGERIVAELEAAGLERVRKAILRVPDAYGGYQDHPRFIVMAGKMQSLVLIPRSSHVGFPTLVIAHYAQREDEAAANNYAEVEAFIALVNGLTVFPATKVIRQKGVVTGKVWLEGPPTTAMPEGRGPGGRTIYTPEEKRHMVEAWFEVKKRGGTSLEEFLRGRYPNIAYDTFRGYVTKYNKGELT